MKSKIKQLTASGSVLLLSILLAGCGTPAGEQDNKAGATSGKGTGGAKPDPRLAGFTGTMDPAYEKSTQDWPESKRFTGNEPNVIIFLLPGWRPDARMQRILNEAAQTGIAEMRATFTSQRDPEYIAWKGRNWEWLILQVIIPETGDFGGPAYLNLEPSETYYFMGYGASAAMGKPAVGAGSVYWGPSAMERGHTSMAARPTS